MNAIPRGFNGSRHTVFRCHAITALAQQLLCYWPLSLTRMFKSLVLAALVGLVACFAHLTWMKTWPKICYASMLHACLASMLHARFASMLQARFASILQARFASMLHACFASMLHARFASMLHARLKLQADVNSCTQLTAVSAEHNWKWNMIKNLISTQLGFWAIV